MNAKFWMVLVLTAGILSPGIGAVAATTDEQTIRDMDAEWSRAAESKDAAKFASFYSETGSVMPFNAISLPVPGSVMVVSIAYGAAS